MKNAQVHAAINEVLATRELRPKATEHLKMARYYIETGCTSYAWSHLTVARDYGAPLPLVAATWVD